MVNDKEQDLEKLKRIKAERAKAEKALEKDLEKEKRINAAYLEMDSSFVKGYSRDPVVIIHRAEKFANIGLVLTVVGLVFSVLTMAASLVSFVYRLGLAGAALSGILGGVQYICLGVGVFLSVVSFGAALYCKIKFGRDSKHVLITAGAAIFVVVLYYLLNYLITRFA